MCGKVTMLWFQMRYWIFWILSRRTRTMTMNHLMRITNISCGEAHAKQKQTESGKNMPANREKRSNFMVPPSNSFVNLTQTRVKSWLHANGFNSTCAMMVHLAVRLTPTKITKCENILNSLERKKIHAMIDCTTLFAVSALKICV